jgi:hypothetical protein
MNNEMNRLRNFLGVMGMLLPVLSLVCNLVFARGYNPPDVLTSISATHYSAAYLFFEGLVISVGVFLLYYRGYDVKDFIVSKLAGTGAIVLSFFPCALNGAETRNFLMLPQNITNPIHLAGAALFFGSLVILIGFQFTKTGEGAVISPESRKWRRNIIYRVCAAVMVMGLVIGFGGKAVFGWKYSVFAGEWVALWAFGPAWLTKGGIILRDA